VARQSTAPALAAAGGPRPGPFNVLTVTIQVALPVGCPIFRPGVHTASGTGRRSRPGPCPSHGGPGHTEAPQPARHWQGTTSLRVSHWHEASSSTVLRDWPGPVDTQAQAGTVTLSAMITAIPRGRLGRGVWRRV
jgi:hypothetical protein